MRDGFEADVKILGDVTLDVAQAVDRDRAEHRVRIIALTSAPTANPLVAVAAVLVARAAADKVVA